MQYLVQLILVQIVSSSITKFSRLVKDNEFMSSVDELDEIVQTYTSLSYEEKQELISLLQYSRKFKDFHHNVSGTNVNVEYRDAVLPIIKKVLEKEMEAGFGVEYYLLKGDFTLDLEKKINAYEYAWEVAGENLPQIRWAATTLQIASALHAVGQPCEASRFLRGTMRYVDSPILHAQLKRQLVEWNS